MSSTIKRSALLEINDRPVEVEAVSVGKIIGLAVKHSSIAKTIGLAVLSTDNEPLISRIADLSDNAICDIVDTVMKQPAGTAARSDWDQFDMFTVAITAINLTIPTNQKKIIQLRDQIREAMVKYQMLTDGAGS